MKLQYKVFTAFLIFILFPIIFLGIISYQISATALKNKVGSETLHTLQAIDLNLQGVVSEIDSFSSYIISSKEIEDFLKYNNQQSLVEFYHKQQAISSIMYYQNKLENLILYNISGDTYQFKSYPIATYDQFLDTSFYRQMLQSQGQPVWLSPAENQEFVPENTSLFTQGRLIKDPNTLDNIGFLILNIQMDRFDTVFQGLHEENSLELLVNKNGEILYDPSHRLIGQTLDLPKLPEILSGRKGSMIDQWHGEKSLISFIPSNTDEHAVSEIFLVSIKPWSVISKETEYIRQASVLLVLFGIFFAILFNLLFLKRIIRFIKEFQESMKQVEEGDFSARISMFTMKELNSLSLGFNRMIQQTESLLNRIKDKEKRKRRAEFQVLQNQINPHFLYNTLESINALAVLNNNKEISRMTINLGKLLRISINSKDEVAVRDEVQHVMSYIEIQKTRFNNRFVVQIDVDMDLKDYFILKLVLQPLVENILQHAFNRQTKEGTITITGRTSGENGCFYIKDNGKGISNEVLKELSDLNQGKLVNDRKAGHGVKNVQERLKLYYGTPYGLTICSMKNAGTTIKLTFPLRKGE